MTSVKWRLDNLINGTVMHIDKSVFSIGRRVDADLSSLSPKISREHATIRLSNEELSIIDHKSTNGTFINGKQIGTAIFRNGDILSFGGPPNLIRGPGFESIPFLFKVVKIDNLASGPTQAEASTSSDVAERSKTEETNNMVNGNSIKKGKPAVNTSSANKRSSIKETPVINQQNSSFTTSANECIIVSDGEDDDFSCSQIFQISEKIKEEPEDYEEGFNPYHDIKEELEYLDYCNERNVISIDLTDDVDHFENTVDLLDVLESTPKRGTQETLYDTLADGIETPASDLLDIPKELNENNSHTVQTAKELTIKKNNGAQVVEPHNASSNKEKEKKTPAKRKSTEVKLPDLGKIKKNRRHSVASDVLNKPQKKEVRELRKQKLKELVSKNDDDNFKSTKKSLNDQPSTSSNIDSPRDNFKATKAPEKLKFSNIEYSSTDQPSTSSNTASGSNKNSKYTKTKISTKTPQLVISIQPNSEDTKVKDSTAPKNKRLDPRLKKVDTVQDTTISSSNFLRSASYQTLNKPSISNPDSTVNEDRSGLIWQIGTNKTIHQSVSNNFRIDINDEIHDLLSWNVGWLLEQHNSDVTAPVNFNKTCVPIPLTFNGIEHYMKVLIPLLNLELWQYIYQITFEKEDRKIPLTVRLEHERKAGRIMYLDCEYIPAQNMPMPFRSEDFCVLEMKLTDSKNYYKYTCFGYIKSISYRNRQNGGGMVTVIIKNLEKKISSKSFIIRICANIGNNTRLLKTIKHLKYSPLCQQVLNPLNLKLTKQNIKNVSIRETPNLNPIQKEISSEASEMALGKSPGFYLIKGPPGTGKSSVIVSIVLEILYKCRARRIQPRILLTAPSNTAIDGLILKLYKARMELPAPDQKMVKIVRIGPDSSINELVNKFTLKFQAKKNILIDKKLNHHPDFKKVCDNLLDSEEFLKGYLGNQYAYEYRVAEDKILLGANLICTTLSSCLSFILNQHTRKSQMKYTCCIIDEATQCNEIECLSPIQLQIDKFILVGDPQQLAAVVCNKEAQQLGFGKSLFSRIAENFPNRRIYQFPIKMLYDQYRMKPEICDYPNRAFYGGTLNSFPKCYNPIEPPLKPYVLFNLKGSDSPSGDYTNTDEVTLISNLLDTLRCYIKPTCVYNIGIITPYKAQKELILKHVATIKFNQNVKITVNTVDSFQGMENDVVIISCVRYSTNYFLANKQRLNVALTRAKQALYVIGNYTLFTQCPPLYNLREDAKKRKLLIDIKTDSRRCLLDKYILS
ncbi:unnamed protein product [Psylliodes chrysocephalus]|uniref:FHA domain-containing protein n=1 Tax=Psylliodes chrysocephalus TaxID=3402493 RepID=A0A9P0D1D0_9CUCU|nr:unnamed protein product [Psylliodes chrysocephala]